MTIRHLFRTCVLMLLALSVLTACGKSKDTPLPQKHTISDLKMELAISAEKEVSAVFNVITPSTTEEKVAPNLYRDGVSVTPELYSSQWESFKSKSTTFAHRGLGMTCTMTFINADESAILAQNKVTLKVKLWQDNKLKSEYTKEIPLKDGSAEPTQIDLWSTQ